MKLRYKDYVLEPIFTKFNVGKEVSIIVRDKKMSELYNIPIGSPTGETRIDEMAHGVDLPRAAAYIIEDILDDGVTEAEIPLSLYVSLYQKEKDDLFKYLNI